MPATSVLQEILTWSRGRPAWQRDALRRIVLHGTLTQEDMRELLHICLSAHSVAQGPAVVATPLGPAHLPAAPEGGPPVSLSRMEGLENVNALAPNQVLTFAPDGLTIIYGENGSGKSGYARVLKRLCHARAPESEILPNVFVRQNAANPGASVHYRSGGTQQRIDWRGDDPAPPELGAVSVFDRECASLYVTDENELAFRPLGLDVFDKLAEACLWIGAKLDELSRRTERERPGLLADAPVGVGTRVGRLLRGLSADTQKRTVEALASMSSEELARLGELENALAADPVAAARDLRLRAGRLKRLQQHIHMLDQALNDEACAGLRKLGRDARTKEEAARTAATAAFGRDPLPGVGSEVWRILWEAARRYSETRAYPQETFPVPGDEARCVLCQQVLADEASDRMRRFEEYVRADTQRLADEARTRVEAAKRALEQLSVRSEAVPDTTEELSGIDKASGDKVVLFLRSAEARRSAVLEACATRAWGDLPQLHRSPADAVGTIVSRLEQRATQVGGLASEEAHQRSLAERDELRARQWLRSHVEVVLKEIDRLARQKRLEACRSDTDTTAITRKNTELSTHIVTTQLRQAFSRELRELRAPEVKVELAVSRGRRGVLYHRLRLTNPANVPVGRVVSEGEYRCLALATFLAEVSTAAGKSAIVLDDPVSSLDHVRRRSVAERLVGEARTRQVVVFTHDIVFLSHLCRAAKVEKIRCQPTTLRHRPGEGYGVCDPDLPWDALSVSKRIGRLRQLQRDADKLFRTQGRQAYDPEAERIYDLLRRTWERAVEEVLLNGVVERFEPEVHTKQVRDLADITEEDLSELDRGMAKCSRFRHDQPLGAAEPVPEPDELHDDIEQLHQWVTRVRNRRRK